MRSGQSPLDALLSSAGADGATTQTVTNADGSTTTTITYADGSTIDIDDAGGICGQRQHRAAKRAIKATPICCERLIALQSQLLAAASLHAIGYRIRG